MKFFYLKNNNYFIELIKVINNIFLGPYLLAKIISN